MGKSRGTSRASHQQRWNIAGIAVVAVAVIFAAYAGFVSLTRSDGEDYVSTYVPGDTGAEPKFTMPSDPRLLVLGDSYTLGTNAQPPTDGYAYKLAGFFGWPTEVDGVGGTGFTWGGGNEGTDGNDYLNRINRRAEAGGFVPNILLLQGGQNDYRADPKDLYSKVRETITAAQTAWPDVQVVVMGPSQPLPGGALLARVSTPIGQAANSENVAFISPIAQKWFTEQNSPGYYGDENGSHLNNEGHLYLASKVRDALKNLGVPAT